MMASSCVVDSPVPVRATYFNLYKWPESDAKFIKSISFSNLRSGGNGRSSGEFRAVDGFARRQLYLRSYTFSTKEDYTAIKGLDRVKDKIRKSFCRGDRRKSGDSVLRRLLSCTIKIDVLD